MMQVKSDALLVGKKILVGLVVTFIPLIILAGSLWLTRTLLTRN